eukprot:TRINITY_DN50774_c0_g1_i1.p1 TRINITY_DN50774_c0_g1~~TRINITY_DN50774_c0_g1_i1.p1  ORF type:complete len:150 (-),score=31.90 TRINITY_DN50774_c0_g1_i1:34-483(-)
MCREEAQEAYSRLADMQAAGASRVVALVKEDIGSEIADFRKDYWLGDVFLDDRLAFFSALGGGRLWKPMSLLSLLAAVSNPFSSSRFKANVARTKRAGTRGNSKGEGFVSGGCYVLRTDGTPSYCFLEEALGDHAPVDDVIRAVSESRC